VDGNNCDVSMAVFGLYWYVLCVGFFGASNLPNSFYTVATFLLNDFHFIKVLGRLTWLCNIWTSFANY
jgi:hypothetical protein